MEDTLARAVRIILTAPDGSHLILPDDQRAALQTLLRKLYERADLDRYLAGILP